MVIIKPATLKVGMVDTLSVRPIDLGCTADDCPEEYLDTYSSYHLPDFFMSGMQLYNQKVGHIITSDSRPEEVEFWTKGGTTIVDHDGTRQNSCYHTGMRGTVLDLGSTALFSARFPSPGKAYNLLTGGSTPFVCLSQGEWVRHTSQGGYIAVKSIAIPAVHNVFGNVLFFYSYLQYASRKGGYPYGMTRYGHMVMAWEMGNGGFRVYDNPRNDDTLEVSYDPKRGWIYSPLAIQQQIDSLLALTSAASLRERQTYWPGLYSQNLANPSTASAPIVYNRNWYIPNISWNELSFEAVQDIGLLTSNGCAMVGDIARVVPETQEYAMTIAKLMSFPGMKKATLATAAAYAGIAASTYLGWHYGLKLFFNDTAEYAEAILNYASLDFNNRHAQAVKSKGNFTYRYSFTYSRYAKSILEKLNLFLEYLDLVPTFENAWDMIPLSFVVDWFVAIGDCLTAVDNYLRLQSEYDIQSVTQTIQGTRPVFDFAERNPSYVPQGDVAETIYIRRVTRDMIPPLPPATVVATSFSHWVEGAALIVSGLAPRA